jgi:hypothetical protein
MERGKPLFLIYPGGIFLEKIRNQKAGRSGRIIPTFAMYFNSFCSVCSSVTAYFLFLATEGQSG